MRGLRSSCFAHLAVPLSLVLITICSSFNAVDFGCMSTISYCAIFSLGFRLHMKARVHNHLACYIVTILTDALLFDTAIGLTPDRLERMEAQPEPIAVMMRTSSVG